MSFPQFYGKPMMNTQEIIREHDLSILCRDTYRLFRVVSPFITREESMLRWDPRVYLDNEEKNWIFLFRGYAFLPSEVIYLDPLLRENEG